MVTCQKYFALFLSLGCRHRHTGTIELMVSGNSTNKRHKGTQNMCNASKTTDIHGFETETCSRCGGSGRHSYCESYKDTCFKCHGKGVVHTKRGAMARDFLTDLMTVPADQVQVGDYIKCGIISSKWSKVISVGDTPEGGKCWSKDNITGEVTYLDRIETARMVHYVAKDTKILKAFRDEASRAQAITKALEYQASLTKSGKLKK